MNNSILQPFSWGLYNNQTIDLEPKNVWEQKSLASTVGALCVLAWTQKVTVFAWIGEPVANKACVTIAHSFVIPNVLRANIFDTTSALFVLFDVHEMNEK